MLKKLVRKAINYAGYELSKKRDYKKSELYDNWESIDNKNIEIKSCIDVGVGFGTLELYEKFPDAYHVLIEPITVYKDYIRNILDDYEGEWIEKAAGKSKSRKEINILKDLPEKSGFLERQKIAKRNSESYSKEVEVDRLDNIILRTNSFPKPYGLKIDAEGYELEVLKGATNVLEYTEFIIIEAPIIERFHNSYSMMQITEFLKEQDFYVGDILDVDKGNLAKFVDIIFYKV